MGLIYGSPDVLRTRRAGDQMQGRQWATTGRPSVPVSLPPLLRGDSECLVRSVVLRQDAAVTCPEERGYCRSNPGTSRTRSESARQRGAWRTKHSESPRKRGGPLQHHGFAVHARAHGEDSRGLTPECAPVS